MTRAALLQHLASTVLSINLKHPVRVGIDGADASGKTFLANELAEELKPSGRPIIRVSIDGFHNPKEIRYQKGRNSPNGYYYDSFDIAAIIDNLLKPLGPNGNLHYKPAIFDFKTDSVVNAETKLARPNTILIMEGVFLFRPKLVDYWDLKLFVDVGFDTTLRRALKRDGYYLGAESEIAYKYQERYIPGQELYFQEAHPQDAADIVIDNTDFENPKLQENR